MYATPSAQRFRKKRMSEINVVPYIDVMLVLLVIFMVTAPLLTQGIKVELPQTDSTPIEQNEQEPIIISVDKDGNYYLNLGDDTDSPITGEILVIRIKAVLRHRKDNTVYVKGDTDANYGKVVNLMALLNQSGVEHVGLVTRMPEKNMPVKNTSAPASQK
ncbi:MAG: protein TolR [Gammaproteobacteria bacterium]|nr:protein TolR [Gammaproteobacteria bacterium]